MTHSQILNRLLTANAVSSFSLGISLIAIPWYFASALNMEGYLARTFQVITFLTLCLSLYAGTLVDRYSRRGIFIGINITGAIVLGAAALLGFREGDVPPALLATVLGFAICSLQIHYPNLYAFGQEVVGKENYGRFSSTIEIQHQASVVLAGLAAILLLPDPKAPTEIRTAGLHIAPWTMPEILLLNAILYLSAFAIILSIRYRPVRAPLLSENFISRLNAGFSYLKKHREVFYFGLVSHAVYIVTLVHGFYLVNLYVNNYLREGSAIYASSEVCYSIGALLAGLTVRHLFRSWIPQRAILVLMIVTIAIHFLLAYTRWAGFLFLFQFLIGLSNAGIRVFRLTYLLSHVDNAVMGRTESIFGFFNILARLLLLLVLGMPFFSEGEAITRAYLTCGIFISLTTLAMWYFSIRKK